MPIFNKSFGARLVIIIFIGLAFNIRMAIKSLGQVSYTQDITDEIFSISRSLNSKRLILKI